MSGPDAMRMLQLVADYATEYETDEGAMTLRELVRDIGTSCDTQEESDQAAEIAESIKWH